VVFSYGYMDEIREHARELGCDAELVRCSTCCAPRGLGFEPLERRAEHRDRPPKPSGPRSSATISSR
jgi:hypothetical protein